MKTDDFIDLIAQDNREDIRQTFGQVLTVPKYILPLIALLPSLWLTVHTRRPEYSLDGRKRWLLAPALITLAMVVIAYSIEPQAAGLAALHGASMLMCLVSIPLLATPILAALLWALKQGACSSPAQTGAIAGIAAGCLSCSMYAFHCIEDSPAFYGVWYTTAVLLVGVAGQQIGKRVLKW